MRAFPGKARSREIRQDSRQGRRMWRVMVIALLNCFDSNAQSFLILTKTRWPSGPDRQANPKGSSSSRSITDPHSLVSAGPGT